MSHERILRLNKLKNLFRVKPNWKIVEYLISGMMNDRLKRNNNDSDDYIKKAETKMDDIIYLLEELQKNNSLSPFQCYKVFKMLLEAEKELQFFNDTIGNIKDYDTQKVIDLIGKAKPFIIGEIKTRIPRNPNSVFNGIYFDLIDDYALKKNDVLNLLSIIYKEDIKSKKAKMPKREMQELKKLKELFIDIIHKVEKDKNLTQEERSKEIEEINQAFKNYL